MTRILLAEDHLIVRNGIKSLLQAEEDFNVIGEASNGIEALSLLDSGIEADVVLTDISMPEMDGLALAREIQARFPDIKVIVLSMMDNERYVFEAFNAGIMGYLLKNTGQEEMVFSIRYVASGKQVICTELGIIMLKRAAAAYFEADAQITSHEFSSRELEVLLLTADGYTNNEIAEKLFTSRRTIEGHRQHMMEKIGVKNTPALIQYAFRAGILK